jgi:glycosyltransferase involved in cell wall biosynthesis
VEDNPLVSVITPTRNRAEKLPRAIASLFSQTHENFELILVDDHSSDETPDLVSSIKDHRLRYIRLPECSGVANARNIGLEAARGEFVCFLDDDDEISPNKLQLQLEKYSRVSSDVGLVYCGSSFFLEAEGRKVMDINPILKGKVYKEMLGRNYLTTITPLVRKECFEVVGGFDTSLLSCSDWDMWIRIARQFEFDFIPDLLGKNYIHGDQISSILDSKIAAREHIMRKYIDDLSRHPASFSDSLRRLGILYCLAREPKKGRACFRRAIATGSGKKSLYAHLLLARFSPALHARMLKKRFTLTVGENSYLL